MTMYDREQLESFLSQARKNLLTIKNDLNRFEDDIIDDTHLVQMADGMYGIKIAAAQAGLSKTQALADAMEHAVNHFVKEPEQFDFAARQAFMEGVQALERSVAALSHDLEEPDTDEAVEKLKTFDTEDESEDAMDETPPPLPAQPMILYQAINDHAEEFLHFKENVEALLNKLTKLIPEMERKHKLSDQREIYELLDDLIMMAEYRGFDHVWRFISDLKKKVVLGGESLQALESAVSQMASLDPRTASLLQSEHPAPAERSAQPQRAGGKKFQFNIDTELMQALEIHLDIMNPLVNDLGSEMTRTMYVDSVENLLTKARAMALSWLEELMYGHKEMVKYTLDNHSALRPEQIEKIQDDLQALNALVDEARRKMVATGQNLRQSRKGPRDEDQREKSRKEVLYTVVNLHVILSAIEAEEKTFQNYHKYRHLLGQLYSASSRLRFEEIKRLAEKQQTILERALYKTARHLTKKEVERLSEYLRETVQWMTEKTDLKVSDFIKDGKVISQKFILDELLNNLDSQYVLQHRLPAETGKVNTMMDSVVALALSQSSFIQLQENFNKLYDKWRDGKTDDVLSLMKDFSMRMEASLDTLNKITMEMEDTVTYIREVPVHYFFNRIQKMAKDAADKRERKLFFTATGTDTTIDLNLLQDVEDPLLHIFKKKIDSGIEKNESMHLRIHAYEDNDQICFAVEDSAQELDPDVIFKEERAIRSNSELLGLSRFEKLNLILSAVFGCDVESPEAKASGVSFVRRNLEKLQCTLDLETSGDHTTKLIVKIPRRPVFFRAMLVRVLNYVYCMPARPVIETIPTAPDSILKIENHEVLRYHEKLITLLRLTDIFNLESAQTGDTQAVIVNTGTKEVAIMIDASLGEKDIVIKPMEEEWVMAAGVSGATILGNGDIALVLDLRGLTEMAFERERALRQYLASLKSAEMETA
ncbi:chemotaxis protein CheW [bacterium]|nr:chemotaxis protein CheW [bacterium]